MRVGKNFNLYCIKTPDIGLSLVRITIVLKMILDNFQGFDGQHCETTATGSLLNQIGIEFSEPMLFGLGQGLGFIFWKMKSMDFPFIGGRVKTDLLTENICANLNLDLVVHETSSKKKAWNLVANYLAEDKAVGLKLDCYHLEYFTAKIHFAGHYVAIYGYDETKAYLMGTNQQGGKVTTSLESLALARSEKGPMSSKHKTYIINKSANQYDLKKAIRKTIYNNAQAYLSPSIKNLTYKGILKASTEIIKWFKQSKDVRGDFQTTSMLMERAGTGGSLFRNLYRDFLIESAGILQSKKLDAAAKEFARIALMWKEVADLFYEAGASGNIDYIYKASGVLNGISEMERLVMEELCGASAGVDIGGVSRF